MLAKNLVPLLIALNESCCPAYTSAMLTLMGLGLSFGTWGAAILNGLVGLLAISYRAHIEEAALMAALGDQYREFARDRWRYFPGV